MSTFRFEAAVALALVYGVAAAFGSLPPPPPGCLVSYNSTSPKGFFYFPKMGFPSTSTPPFNMRSANAERCAVLCAKYLQYGFQIRTDYVEASPECHCLRSAPQYSYGVMARGETYTRVCPKLKAPPPPKKAPPPPKKAYPPPPPAKPLGCKVKYNSSYPGYFELFYNPNDYNVGMPILDLTPAVDVWPSNYYCSVLCKNYYWGFYLGGDYERYILDCQCIKSAIDYSRFGPWISETNVIQTKSCPSKV